MTDGDDHADGQATDIPRRALLGAVGAAAAGLGALPSGVAARGERATDPSAAAGRSHRSRLYPVESDFHGSTPQRLRAKRGCFKPRDRPIYGPTDVNAQSANGRMAAALNDEGTVTVLRWPRPSFYEQLKYFAEGRDADDEIVVAPNMGAFLGVAADTGDGFETTWLRDFDDVEQRYRNDLDGSDAEYSDEIVTRYADDDLGLVVRFEAVVARETDALVRRVRVTRRGDSPVEAARLVAFQNPGLVVGKFPQYPVQDWCLEEDNDHRARYVDRLDAVVHDRSGVDQSTGEQRSVALAVGFDGETAGFQVGGDAHDPAAEPTGREGPAVDAYDDAADGTLSGNDSYVGQATSAVSTALDFGPGAGGTAEETVVLAAGADETEVATVLGRVRDARFGRLRDDKEAWIADLLADAPLPNRETIAERESAADTDAIVATARRALVTLVTTYDRESGAIVASITTQPPYGEDWPRDGAFFNYILDLIGRDDWVEKRNRWYASLQQQTVDSVAEGDVLGPTRPSQRTSPNTLQANWNMNYYADGVAGGPIPYQIDTTGFTVWTMVDHYEVTGDEAYLRAVWPAIRRAADYLVDCRDPRNGLQCRNFEDDRPSEPDRQTVNGAIPAWQGLTSAARAARVLGNDDDAARYETRRHELGRAIDEVLYDEEAGCYGTRRNGFPYGETTWPLGFTPYTDPETGALCDRPQVDNPFDHPRIQAHLTRDGETIPKLLAEPEAGETDDGGYDSKALIPLAKARRGEDEPRSLSAVRDAIRWVGTRHATDDTHVMGEFWRIFGEGDDREVKSIQGQPHVWEQVLFYLAALEAYPPDDLEFEPATMAGVTGALRE
ncbi:hypothetical protein BRC88_08605 [Halobacteriales archaeon QS_4_69_225]|nr:MAG: hypothetical protein BRC88_08605 [Halobacteriales archaeon QS_4_69_225]